jgi:cytochrome c551
MRRLLVLALPVLLTTTLACDSGGDDGDGGDNSAVLALSGDAAAGQTVFSANACATAGCHGADGNSGSAPALRDVIDNRTDDQIIDAVLDGKGGMPPQDLTNQQMADVLAWLRDTF